jgi:hypothetical protein
LKPLASGSADFLAAKFFSFLFTLWLGCDDRLSCGLPGRWWELRANLVWRMSGAFRLRLALFILRQRAASEANIARDQFQTAAACANQACSEKERTVDHRPRALINAIVN